MGWGVGGGGGGGARGKREDEMAAVTWGSLLLESAYWGDGLTVS